VAGFEEIAGHRVAHQTETEKSEFCHKAHCIVASIVSCR
jgi:hypothetical protein